MAEEKKTGKKFCTKCGKPLKEGEVCDCQKEKKEVKKEVVKEVVKETPKRVEQPRVVSQPVNNQVNQPVYGNVVVQPAATEPNKFVVFIKSVWKDTILEAIKNPYDTIKRKYEEKNTFETIMMLLLISISFGFMLCCGISALMDASLGSLASQVDMPYVGFFIFFLILSFIYSFIPISGAFITGKIPKLKPTNELDYKDIMSIYATSNSPMVYIYLAMGILLFLGITHWILWLLLLVCMICCWSNFIVSYLGIASPEKNMKAYSISLILILTIVIIALVIKLFGDTISDSFVDIISDISAGGVSVGDLSSLGDISSILGSL